MPRRRIDLDGVTLANADNPAGSTVVTFRYRTTDGIVVLIPESADELIPWKQIETASLDLKSGELRLQLTAEFVDRQRWLRGARQLTGRWMDRLQIATAHVR